MKKLGIGFAVLIVILAGVILVVPGFLNWNEYKSQIEQTASYYSGRTVTIKGDISLSLLPTSALSAKDVTVANLKNGRAEHMISLKSLDIKVSFPSVIASLFGGKLKVEKLILVDPVIALEVLKDGRKNWNLTKASGPEETNTSADISLEKFQIINGQISFEDMSSGRRELLGKINANIRAKSIRGPFVVTGRAKYRGLEAKISLDLGKDRSGNRIPLTAKIALLNGQLKAAAIGGVILNGKDSAYSGKLKITASDVGNFFDVFDRLTNRKLPGTISFGQDFALDTRIAVSANKATARNLTFRMGQSRGQGRAEISLSAKIKGAKINFLTQLTVNKLDLDKLLTALNGPARGIADHRPRNIPAGSRVKPDWLDHIAGKADISLGALRYNGKIASRIALKLAAKNAVIDITTLRARMPGGAALTFSGQVATASKPVLTGKIALNASNLRGLLSWLKLDVTDVPAGQLTQFSYNSGVELTPALLQLYAARGRLDAMSFTGGLSYALTGRPSYGIKLDIRNLNLDFYLKPQGDGNSPQPAQKSDFSRELARLDKFDARYALTLSNFTLHGIRLRSGELDGLLLGGKLAAQTIKLTDIAGINLVASAQGGNFARKPEVLVKLAASAKSLTSLRRTLEVAKIFAAGRFEAINPGRMTLNGTIAASFSKMTVDIKSRIGTSRFDVKGTMRTSPAHKSADIDRANLDIDISSPSLRTMIDQFNLPLTRPGLRDDHPLRIKGHLTLGPDMMAVAGKINIATGVISVTGRREGRSEDQSKNQSAGQREAGSVDMTVDVQGPQTREFIRGLGIDFQPAARKLGPIAVKFRLTGNHDQYALNNIAGTLGSVKLDGSGKIDLGSARPYFNFNLKVGNIPLDNFLKTNAPETTGKTTGKTTGEYGQWNRQAMDLSLLSAYNGRVKISADSLRYNKFIFKKPAFEAVLNDGILAINNFTGQLFGGTVILSGQLASAKGDSMPKIAVTIDLKKASLSRAGKILAGVTPVSGRFDLTAKFAGEGVSQYDIISSLSGNGKLVTGPGIITGIDIPTLSKQLSSMSSNDAFANLLRTVFAGGKTSYKGSISHIVAKDGRINFNPFDIALNGANSTVKMSLDLLNWTIHSQGSLLLVAHPDAPPIGVLIDGTISSPDIRYRTERLKKYVGAKIASHMLQKLVGGKGDLEGMFGTGSPPKKPGAKKTSPAPTGHNKQPPRTEQPAQSGQPAAAPPKSGEEFSKRLLQKLFGKDKKATKDGPQ